MLVKEAETNETKKCFPVIAVSSETFATFPVVMLYLLGLQPAFLHRLLNVVLWIVVTQASKAFRLRNTINSLGSSLLFSA